MSHPIECSQSTPFEEAYMSGRVVHFELPVDDQERAKAFYAGAFGWNLADVPGMAYTMVTTTPSGDRGPATAYRDSGVGSSASGSCVAA